MKITSSTTTTTGTGGVSQTPTQMPSGSTTDVPKGQLERTRSRIPTGWHNDGGHKGFKAASITQVADGYRITAVNAGDIPRGRR